MSVILLYFESVVVGIRVPGIGYGRPDFDRLTCRHRNTVERCIDQLTQERGAAVHTDKVQVHHLTVLHVAAISL
ncbi:hypothetical protein [Streptomyces sp. NPDC056480]|uniref:hypothetical protein n=1 Tax=Streptomyces sp. NPDC056480 TaxID=3345833 RepID=UPI00368AA055